MVVACPECGYDLTKNQADLCPECGFAVVSEARQDWDVSKLPGHRRNPVGSVAVAGVAPSVLLLPFAIIIGALRGDSCVFVSGIVFFTVVLLLIWVTRLNDLDKGPASAFRRSTPLLGALAWAWPVLLLVFQLAGPTLRWLSR